jgi:hypothetical protein
MARTTEQVLLDQQRQADARHASAHGAEPVPIGLDPLHALQHFLWGWHDMRRHGNASASQSTRDYSQADLAAIACKFLKQAATTATGEPMVTKNDAFPSRFFKAADLLDGPIVLTVLKAPLEELKYQGRAEEKVVLYFRQTKKVLSVNSTNFDAMIKVTGKSNSDDWVGCKIELYPAQTQYRGETVDCIRIRKPGEGQDESATSEPVPGMDDSIPF